MKKRWLLNGSKKINKDINLTRTNELDCIDEMQCSLKIFLNFKLMDEAIMEEIVMQITLLFNHEILTLNHPYYTDVNYV